VKTLLSFALLCSLAANLFLLIGKRSSGGSSRSLATDHRSLAQTPLASSPAVVSSTQPPAGTGATAPRLDLAAFQTKDLTTLRDALRAAGASPALVSAVLEGELRARYREADHAKRMGRLRQWWRETSPSTIGQKRPEGDGPLLKEHVTDPLLSLVGTPPSDLTVAASRYDFLPVEKQRLLAQIDVDYGEVAASIQLGDKVPVLRADEDRFRLLADEKRKDVLAALTPEERSEYDLRFSPAATVLRSRLTPAAPTEDEYRIVYAAAVSLFDANSLSSGRIPNAFNETLIAKLGSDRAAAFAPLLNSLPAQFRVSPPASSLLSPQKR
jgi:hypothetical protein